MQGGGGVEGIVRLLLRGWTSPFLTRLLEPVCRCDCPSWGVLEDKGEMYPSLLNFSNRTRVGYAFSPTISYKYPLTIFNEYDWWLDE